MVLVGLGADERARKIVNFLADTGVEIELLTFHAFENDGTVFLARQIERTSPVRPPRPAPSATKETNLQVLHDTARRLGVYELLEDAASVVSAGLPGSYKWPGKTAYAFSLSERTTEGNPTLRLYVGLYLDDKRPGALTLMVHNRAVQCAQAEVDGLLSRLQGLARIDPQHGSLDVQVNQASWSSVLHELKPLLAAVAAGWRNKMQGPVAETEGMA